MFKVYKHRILVLIFVSLNFVSCGGGGSSTPSGGKYLTVSWTAPTKNTDGSDLIDLSGYKLYYGVSPEFLTSSVTLNSGTNSYIVKNLAGNTKYYFAVTAINNQNVESYFSTLASKTTEN